MRRIAKLIELSSLLLALLVVWGCASVFPGPGDEKGEKEEDKIEKGYFRHRWWNYYDRALTYAEIPAYAKSVADLEEALRQRDEDQRMARTYGMHFIDYFPHRELGVVRYQMGEFEKAETELEVSLDQYPSAKAQFYLERVRKALIEQEGKEITEPKLNLHFDADPVWTREDPVVLSGAAEDEMYVAGIRINGAPLFIEGSRKQLRFHEELSLGQGRHLVSVEARNLLGGTTKQEVVIHVDRQGPMIIIEELAFGEGKARNEVMISGFLQDEAGVSALKVDGKAASIEEGPEVPFSYRRAADTGVVELCAKDRLGNQTTAKIPLKPGEAGRSAVQLAFADDADADGYPLVSLLGFGDTSPPKVNLEGWTDSQVVYLAKVYLEGRVSDAGRIASLTVNRIPVVIRRGRMIFFNQFVELEEGENQVTIEASDEAGNSASRGISITRKVPKALQLKERLSLSVLPMEQGGAVSDGSLFFQYCLIDALVDRNRFRVLERDHLSAILEEQKLSQSELIDRTTALRLGKLAAVHAIVTGSMIETHTGIEIVTKMIDTETSEILATEDVYDENKDSTALKALAEAMAIKIHRDFPLVGGLVIERKKKHIFTDLGEEEIRRQRRVLVYRETVLEHPVTKKPVGTDNEIIGRAVFTQVMPEASKAEVVSGREEEIQPLDKVITQ